MIFQEKIICSCGYKTKRKLEIKTTNMRSNDMDAPLNILLIKKFECPKCKGKNKYQLNIIKE